MVNFKNVPYKMLAYKVFKNLALSVFHFILGLARVMQTDH